MGETALRIIDIPPYQRAGVNYDPAEGHFMMKDLIASLKAKGQLDGVEIDVDEGEPAPHGEESRDESVAANIAVGIVNRIKAMSATGKYDAVITQAGIEPGFLAVCMVCKIPVAYPVHSAWSFAPSRRVVSSRRIGVPRYSGLILADSTMRAQRVRSRAKKPCI